MIKSITKRVHVQTVGWGASLGLIALGFASQASASCMNTDKMLTPTAFNPGDAQMAPAVWSPVSDAPGAVRFVQVSDDGEDAGIVGLWQFKMTGFSVDWGTQAWHSDGTELMFSGGQNPATGDVCQGVWRKVGANTYTLNHIALGWMAPGGPYGLRVHVHMVVKLDSAHHSFSGSYKAAVYAVSPQDPFDEHVKVADGTGDVTATRVNPD
jgi:hypothetical protein